MNSIIILSILLNSLYLTCDGLPQYQIEGGVPPSSPGQATFDSPGANPESQTPSSGSCSTCKGSPPKQEESRSGGWVAPTPGPAPSDQSQPKIDLKGLNIAELSKVGALGEHTQTNSSEDSFITTVHERKVTKVDLTKLTEFQNAILKLTETQKAAEAKRKVETEALKVAMEKLQEQARQQAQANIDIQVRNQIAAQNEARLKAMQAAYIQMQARPKVTLARPINGLLNSVYQSLIRLEALPNVQTQPLPSNIQHIIMEQPVASANNIDMPRLHEVQTLIYKLSNAQVDGYSGVNPLAVPLNTMLTSVDSVLNRLQQILSSSSAETQPSYVVTGLQY